jgi:hypothetical protein
MTRTVHLGSGFERLLVLRDVDEPGEQTAAGMKRCDALVGLLALHAATALLEVADGAAELGAVERDRGSVDGSAQPWALEDTLGDTNGAGAMNPALRAVRGVNRDA